MTFSCFNSVIEYFATVLHVEIVKFDSRVIKNDKNEDGDEDYLQVEECNFEKLQIFSLIVSDFIREMSYSSSFKEVKIVELIVTDHALTNHGVKIIYRDPSHTLNSENKIKLINLIYTIFGISDERINLGPHLRENDISKYEPRQYVMRMYRNEITRRSMVNHLTGLLRVSFYALCNFNGNFRVGLDRLAAFFHVCTVAHDPSSYCFRFSNEKDISPGGVMVTSDQPLKRNQILFVRVLEDIIGIIRKDAPTREHRMVRMKCDVMCDPWELTYADYTVYDALPFETRKKLIIFFCRLFDYKKIRFPVRKNDVENENGGNNQKPNENNNTETGTRTRTKTKTKTKTKIKITSSDTTYEPSKYIDRSVKDVSHNVIDCLDKLMCNTDIIIYHPSKCTIL